MSVRGAGKKKSNERRKLPVGILLWMIFFIIILLLFIIYMPSIRKTLQSTHIVERLTNTPIAVEIEVPQVVDEQNPPVSVITVSPPGSELYMEIPEAAPAGSGAAVIVMEEEPTAVENPVGAGAENPLPPVSAAETAAAPETRPETRERAIYFVKIDNSGLVFTSPVKRRVFVSDSPLLDVLNLLLQGPTEVEQKEGFASLIPEGVRIQNARVTNNTAVISFNENFMFNSYGAEGYIAQLRQIVWTATEFPNVYDVQILIEGRRVEFLGESIRIGRPIGRDSL
jgi:spore germination protein GerM